MNVDQCQYGFTPRDEQGVGGARKATGFMTTSTCVAQELQRKCSNRTGHAYHRHVRLEKRENKGSTDIPPMAYAELFVRD